MEESCNVKREMCNGENLKSKMVNQKSKTKGVIGMKKLIGLGIGALMVCALGTVAFAGPEHAEVDVYVTPGGITASLTSPTSYYNFETLNLGVSSNSATAVTLDNETSCGVKITKSIQAIDAGGTIILTNDAPADIPADNNKFRLRCVEKSDRADLGDTEFSVVHTTFSTLTNYNVLTDTSGVQVSLAADDQTGEQCNIWFQIDMPYGVDNQDQRKFDLTFQATIE